MSAASMWTAMQAAIAAVTPYQGSDPVASAAYRAAVGEAMCTAIISEQNTPIAWDGTNDRVLDVGQFTQDSFTSATSMPLHIACGDGQVYEIELNGNYTVTTAASSGSYLQSNNTAPATNSFDYTQIYAANAVATASYGTAALGGFAFTNALSSAFSAEIKVFTSTNKKRTLSHSTSQITGTQYAGILDVSHSDITTVWSSLGTVIQPIAWTGQIVCRRVS